MPRLTDPKIGEQIARYRKLAKITAEDLATRADNGLTRSIIANLENGRKQDITTSQLLAIAFVLGVSPSDLLFDLRLPYAYMELIPAGDRRNEVRVPMWLAREWFGGRLNVVEAVPLVDRQPMTDEARKAVPVGVGDEATAYYLRRRSDLLQRLGGFRKAARELRSNTEESARARGDLYWVAPDTSDIDGKIRDVQSELYEVESTLRKLRVDLDEPIHPGPPWPF